MSFNKWTDEKLEQLSGALEMGFPWDGDREEVEDHIRAAYTEIDLYTLALEERTELLTEALSKVDRLTRELKEATADQPTMALLNKVMAERDAAFAKGVEAMKDAIYQIPNIRLSEPKGVFVNLIDTLALNPEYQP